MIIVFGFIFALSLLVVIPQYEDVLQEVAAENVLKFLVAALLFTIGSPFFVVNNVICGLLDFVMPEDWDVDL